MGLIPFSSFIPFLRFISPVLRSPPEALDRAVLSAYAATDGWLEDWSAVWPDTGAAHPLSAGHSVASRRAEVDQNVPRGRLPAR